MLVYAVHKVSLAYHVKKGEKKSDALPNMLRRHVLRVHDIIEFQAPTFIFW